MTGLEIPESVRAIGFDLDDTLHQFKRASGRAAQAVFAYISDEFGTPVRVLETAYRDILRHGQSHHFTEDRTSREYRSDRFTRLLEGQSILPNGHLQHLLDIYDSVLGQSLTLMHGAEDVVQQSKAAGYRTFIVSEGPYDAQEVTLQRLGLTKYVDALFTSSREGMSKSGGLFPRVIQRMNIQADQALFVGDSLQRDILPARAAGMHAMHFTSEPSADAMAFADLGMLATELRKRSLFGAPRGPSIVDLAP